MRALFHVLALALFVGSAAPGQEPSRQAQRQHEQLVTTYIDAETALLRELREATRSGTVPAEQQARLEQLARTRDIAQRRAQESALVTGLSMPSRHQVLERASASETRERLFPRAEELVQAARRADTRRLVVTVGLPKEI